MRITTTLTREIADEHGFHEYDCLQEQIRTLMTPGVPRIPLYVGGQSPKSQTARNPYRKDQAK